MTGVAMDHFLMAIGIIGDRPLTDELLSDVLAKLVLIDSSMDAVALDKVRKQLESTIGISITTGAGLSQGRREPWLDDRRTHIQWDYWSSYTRQLQASSFGKEVIRVLGEDADNILTECGNPADPEPWAVRGLVMGDVQSGKTASYGGLIAKGADAGYKVIVLLTGMIEELRSQTQGRLDEGFVGKDSRDLLSATRNDHRIGAGRFRGKIPNVLTSVDSDFLSANARALGGIPLENINEPVLFVMKKNKSPLENLIGFLDSQLKHGNSTLGLPLLLIDDEADNASVNVRKDEDPATINKLIRALISRFSRSTYVAYTATPFANVFINPDIESDLFPSDFIYSLNSPSNYIGAADIFLEGGEFEGQLRDIEDAEPAFPFKHKKEWVIGVLPQSIKDAIQTFLLSCAIRDSKNELLKHRSMLVNVSRFNRVQLGLAELLKTYLHELTEEVKQYLSDADIWGGHQRLAELHECWEREFSTAGVSWDQVRIGLYEAIASIKVVTINQNTEAAEKLNYRAYKNGEKGRRVIAIGGLTLSRGLTLEGLCVSYFYRDSKAYDTLLQMGRWFGYRHGYEDLFRIWMDGDVQDWFSHISGVVDELRADIRRMHANRLPPSMFGIRVRSHPDTLIVTALNKMRNAEQVTHAVSFSGYGVETPFLPVLKEINVANVTAVRDFLTRLPKPRALAKGTRLWWEGISSREIGQLLNAIDISEMNIEFVADIGGSGRPLISFITSNQVESLRKWDLCIPMGEGSDIPDVGIALDDGTVRKIFSRQRQFERSRVGVDYLKLNKQRVGDVSDEMVNLDPEALKAATDLWEEERRKDKKKGERVPGYIYRRFRSRPLLTINFIEPVSPKDGAKHASRMLRSEEIDSRVLVAISLSFPHYEDHGSQNLVPYRLNRVALRNLGYLREDSEDED